MTISPLHLGSLDDERLQSIGLVYVEVIVLSIGKVTVDQLPITRVPRIVVSSVYLSLLSN